MENDSVENGTKMFQIEITFYMNACQCNTYNYTVLIFMRYIQSNCKFKGHEKLK